MAKSFKGKLGGKRPGAGRPAGTGNKKTLDQKIVMEAFRQRVLKSSNKLINAQMNLANGVSYLMKITTHKNRKEVEVIKDPTLIAEYFAETLVSDDNEYYYITTEKPENKALDSLFDRVLGKAQASIDITTKGESLNKMGYERARDIIAAKTRRGGSDKSDSSE